MQQGTIVELKIFDQNEGAYFGQMDGETIRIEKELVDEPYSIDDTIEGMYYIDKKDIKRLSPVIPDARLDAYGKGRVVDVRRDLGVFVDIGLYQKDIVVSLDDLPENKQEWPKVGDHLFISLKEDDRNRLWGQLITPEMVKKISRKAPRRLMNQNINLTIYRLLNVGVQTISEEYFEVFVHESELLGPVRLGEQVEGRVIEVHPDGRLNASLRPRVHESIDDDAQLILSILERIPNGFLPLHDRSTPKEINDQFDISKGQFKRAVGQLMRLGKIEQIRGKGIQRIDE